MKKTIFSFLSVARRFLRKVGIARSIIKIPHVARLFWFTYAQSRPQSTTMVAVRDFGFKMYVDPRDKNISPMLLMTSCYEPFASRIFRSLVREGMAVVDIGAHVGYYTLLAATQVGESGKVFSFEPEPRNFNLLCQNTSLNGLTNVVPQQKALLDRAGTCQFYMAAENFGRHGIYRQDDTVDQIAVETTTLDDFFLAGTKRFT